MDTAVAHALVRFGLGRRGGEPLPADPGAWLRASSAARIPALANPADPRAAGSGGAARGPGEPAGAGAVAGPGAVSRQDAAAQLGNALTTPAPFRERLVWFWTNHFTVSLRRGDARALAGAFVEEAIRPHVTGRFADMLLAVMRHPGDAAVSRQRRLGRARTARPASAAGAG